MKVYKTMTSHPAFKKVPGRGHMGFRRIARTFAPQYLPPPFADVVQEVVRASRATYKCANCGSEVPKTSFVCQDCGLDVS